MAPKKRAPASDYDSDSGFVADAPRSKKSKTAKDKDGKQDVGIRIDKGGGGEGGLDAKRGKVDGEDFWGISDKGRRVTISSYKGKTMVSIREYYEQNGKVLPGKKGISLTVEQFSSLITVLPEIETALKEKGVEVPRPGYEGHVGLAEGDGEEGREVELEEEKEEKEEEEGGDKEPGEEGKKNFEETSEEDE